MSKEEDPNKDIIICPFCETSLEYGLRGPCEVGPFVTVIVYCLVCKKTISITTVGMNPAKMPKPLIHKIN